MGTGIFRDGAYVLVNYEDMEAVSVSVPLYRQRGYKPPVEWLPSKEEYQASDFVPRRSHS